jgi:hypothetical protein
MTYRQRVFLKKLPACNNNISLAMRESGYTQSSSQSGGLYKSMRNLLRERNEAFFSEEGIKKDYRNVYHLAKRKRDTSSLIKILDSRSRIAGLFKDNVTLTHDISAQASDIINKYIDEKAKQRGAIDVSASSAPIEPPLLPTNQENAKDIEIDGT